MSDETTPLIFGDAAAAELGRAPRRNWLHRKKKTRPPFTHCENCGAELTGPYCAKCGQPAIDYHRSFVSLLADAADAFFNLDERFLKTFGLLLIKPWRLTTEFVEGKRVRHVHPLRVYLIASVLFFLVINYLARNTHLHTRSSIDVDTAAALARVPLGPLPPAPSATPSWNFASSFPPAAQPSPTAREIFPDLDQETDAPAFAKWIQKRTREKIGPTGDRGDLFLKALIQNLAPMVLCCIPLFALVLKILYVFKRRYYIEHLIFALHTHAFVFLSTLAIIGVAFLLAWKAPRPLVPIVCVFLGLAVLVQLLVAIRRVYRQNWFATLFKFALGSVIYLIMLSFAFFITAFVTLLLP
ncbi:MAG TPA: DUF3667 domain-containing protein [Chthoniobacterales bacterium]